MHETLSLEQTGFDTTKLDDLTSYEVISHERTG